MNTLIGFVPFCFVVVLFVVCVRGKKIDLRTNVPHQRKWGTAEVFSIVVGTQYFPDGLSTYGAYRPELQNLSGHTRGETLDMWDPFWIMTPFHAAICDPILHLCDTHTFGIGNSRQSKGAVYK